MSNTQNFPSVQGGKKFSEVEKEILEYWKENRIFEKSVEKNPEDKEFVFFDGPPFATGTPHYGHILAGAIKDVIPRYKTMQGYRVNRKFGWDCHGVPVEFLIEKEHKIGGKPGIEKMGTGVFNDLCQSAVMRCADEWENTVERMGRFVDFKNDYKTMDPDYMESVWSVFRALWDKGLIYEGEKVIPYSPRLGSPLSNFEANQNYKQIKDKTLIVKFELENENLKKSFTFDKYNTNFDYKKLLSKKTYLLAWTTTPWTLPSNLALCVNPKLEYSFVKKGEDIFIVASSLVEKTFAEDIQIIKTLSGKELAKQKYKPLFPYYTDHKNAFQILIDDFVSADSGTGIVHLAPNFGEDDANVCTKNGIRFLEQPIDENGYFNELAPELEGKYFRADEVIEGSKENNGNDSVIKILKEKNKVFKQDQYDHEYPFCWRTDCALMYRGIKTWFVDVQKVKQLMIEKNQEINWSPEHLKNGRFGKILETAPDWAISRNRYWGAPIPVWKCENEECDHTEVVSTRSELEEKTGKKSGEISDIHKQYVDELTWKCEKCDGKMLRIPEVLDCWFESGAMPYASRGVHFQNENSSKPVQADFIAEGLDQTRGWFYTLHVLGCALIGENIYKNVITNGIVLAEDGQKMSKSKQNYPDPNVIFDKYGADAMRFYMLSSPVVRAENFRFIEKGVEEVMKKILLPLHNVYSFFSTYANIDSWVINKYITSKDLDPKMDLDKWILSEYEYLRSEYTDKFESYKLDEALKLIPNFIDSLTNWYVRRSRDRFWESGISEEKNSGYSTLFFILTNFAKILAPICPFYADFLWISLNKNIKNSSDSIHLTNLSEPVKHFKDIKLSNEISLLRDIISLSAKIRARKKIKNRQPLSNLSFAISGNIKLSSESVDILKEEVNVKNINFLESLEGIAKKIVKPNARLIGKKFGKKTQEIIKNGKIGNFEILENKEVKILDEILSNNEYEIGFECNEGIEGEGNNEAVVLLNTEISEVLKLEGLSRELIRGIQESRKNSGFEISDRIFVNYFTSSETLLNVLKNFGDNIDRETLTINRKLLNELNLPKEKYIELNIEGEIILLDISKCK
jgi:isoleucyl-tRNA synthetase